MTLSQAGQQALEQAHDLVEQIAEERDRLASERMQLLAVGQQDRADSVLGLIEVLEAFVSDRFARVEKMALDGDEDAAFRLRRAASNILASVSGTSATSDFVEDAKAQSKEALADLKIASIGVGAFVVAGLAAYVLLVLKR